MTLQNVEFEIVTDSIERAVEIINKIDPKQFRPCASMTIRIVDQDSAVRKPPYCAKERSKVNDTQ